MEWGEQEALPGRCELGSSGSQEKCILGAEQGQGLGLCWQEVARPHSALRVPAWSQLPSGMAKWRWEIILSMWAQLVLGEPL